MENELFKLDRKDSDCSQAGVSQHLYTREQNDFAGPKQRFLWFVKCFFSERQSNIVETTLFCCIGAIPVPPMIRVEQQHPSTSTLSYLYKRVIKSHNAKSSLRILWVTNTDEVTIVISSENHTTNSLLSSMITALLWTTLVKKLTVTQYW